MKNTLFYNYNYQTTKQQITKLSKLPFSKSNTRRLCYHKNEKSKLKYMLIELKKNSMFPMHYHKKNEELVILLKGDMEIDLIENKLKKKIKLNKVNNFIFFKKNVKNKNKTKNGCLYLEIKLGPFKKENTTFI